jgi:hypothetical protein
LKFGRNLDFPPLHFHTNNICLQLLVFEEPRASRVPKFTEPPIGRMCLFPWFHCYGREMYERAECHLIELRKPFGGKLKPGNGWREKASSFEQVSDYIQDLIRQHKCHMDNRKAIQTAGNSSAIIVASA